MLIFFDPVILLIEIYPTSVKSKLPREYVKRYSLQHSHSKHLEKHTCSSVGEFLDLLSNYATTILQNIVQLLKNNEIYPHVPFRKTVQGEKSNLQTSTCSIFPFNTKHFYVYGYTDDRYIDRQIDRSKVGRYIGKDYVHVTINKQRWEFSITLLQNFQCVEIVSVRVPCRKEKLF